MNESAPLFVDKVLDGKSRQWLINIDSLKDKLSVMAYHVVADSVQFVGGIKLPGLGFVESDNSDDSTGSFQFLLTSGSSLNVELDNKDDLLVSVTDKKGKVVSRYTLSE